MNLVLIRLIHKGGPHILVRRVSGDTVLGELGRIPLTNRTEDAQTELTEIVHREALAGSRRFVFDLRELSHISSSGLCILLNAFSTVRKADAHLVVIHSNEKVSNLLALTRIDKTIPERETLTDARRYFRGLLSEAQTDKCFLAWATDIHLNAAEEDTIHRFCDDIRASAATALLLGGDLAEAPSVVLWLEFLAEHTDIPIYFVLGNHDYYGSSVAAVREQIRELEHPNLHWLPKVGCVPLSSETALVGHGGWADGRIGDFDRSPIMTDFLAIEDLILEIDRDDLLDEFKNRGPLQRRLQELGHDAARTLEPSLLEAAAGFREVIVLTHVPPFREASWYDGNISPPEWLPNTTSKAVGDLLLEVAETHEDVHIKVLCGHTHGEGHARIAPNLEVVTGAARYGNPRFTLMELNPEEKQ